MIIIGASGIFVGEKDDDVDECLGSAHATSAFA
jgi:hypothetical protein